MPASRLKRDIKLTALLDLHRLVSSGSLCSKAHLSCV